ncbi:MAG: hypothetical protein AAF826_08985 [Pseudomonadota bacterium]
MRMLFKALVIGLLTTQVTHANAGEIMAKEVTEIVIFKVSDPEAGMEAARLIVEDAKAFNNAIVSAEIYQSASDPNTIAQRITWTSIEEAKSAFEASPSFPNMEKAMAVMTEQVLFDHFYLK